MTLRASRRKPISPWGWVVACAALCGASAAAQTSGAVHWQTSPNPSIFDVAADEVLLRRLDDDGACPEIEAEAPQIVLTYEAGERALELSLVNAREDVVLAVRPPDGAIRCASFDRGHRLGFAEPESGQYLVWITSAQPAGARLQVASVNADELIDPYGGLGPPYEIRYASGIFGPMTVRTATQGPPPFPRWPPPRASARQVVDRAIFASDRTIGHASGRLLAALRGAGYARHSFYSVPGGIAIVARLERIRSDARPEQGPQRFVAPRDGEAPRPENPIDFIQTLFFAPAGSYRQLVFVISDRPVLQSGWELSADEAAALLAQGGRTLDAAAAQPFTTLHRVSALIYEFNKEGDAEAAIQTPGRWDAETHLVRSGVLVRLRRD